MLLAIDSGNTNAVFAVYEGDALRASWRVFAETNAVIRSEAKKFPQVTVADWDSWSAGKPWFRPDGLHLTADGATALAQFLRPYLAAAATEIRSATSTP